MSDLSKVVQELKITNQKLEILEKQNIENETPKARALDALPEIIAGRSDTNKSIKEDEKRDKASEKTSKERNESSLKSTDQVSTEILKQDDILVALDDNAAQRDEARLGIIKANNELLELQTIQNERIGPPSQIELDNIKMLQQNMEFEEEQLSALEQQRQELIQQSKLNKAVEEEKENERVKSLKEVFNSSFIGKGIMDISKSISGFVGGMVSGVKSGGEAILKGLITAGALGLIITFLKSDTFKKFLSEENIKRLVNFYQSVKDYFKDLYTRLADPKNRESLLFKLGAAAIGASIIAIVGGVKLIGGMFKKIGAMFGLKSSLGLANTQLDKDIAAANKSSKKGLARSSKFLKFLKLGGFIGLALSTIEGVQEGFKAYSEGGDAKEIFGRFVGGVTESLTFGILDAKKTAAFLGLGGPEAKIKKVEEQLKNLDKMIAEGKTTITETGRGGIKKVTVLAEQRAKLQSELEELKEEKTAKDNRKKNRESEAQYENDKKAFLEERAKELGIEKRKNRSASSLLQTRNKEEYDKAIAEFEEKFGKAAKLVDDRTPKEVEKELAKIQSSVPVMKVLQELTSTPGVNIQNLKSDVGAFGGMGQTINVNTVNKAGDTQNIQNNKTIANNQVSNVNLPLAMTRSAYPF